MSSLTGLWEHRRTNLQQEGGKNASNEDTNASNGDEEDEDDDGGGGSTLPSWLKDLTRQKSENEESERAK